jgi:hypothetical protein
MQDQRRSFLKITAVGAAGLALGRTKNTFAAWPSSGTLEINPDISNMRVVACKDATMMKSTPTAMSFAAQHAAVDAARVHANMDAMAMQLAQKTTADEAWKTIFRSSKPWASTLVAIKVNMTEPKNMNRVAVVEKLCRVLAGFGVPASNLIVYDGGPASFSKNISAFEPYFSTTDTSKIPGVISSVSDALGGTTSASLPNGTSATCTADIAKGKVDILINVGMNRGHTDMGRATLCMKNHFGTFAPNHTDLTNYVFNINKSDAIVGGTPVRQQLCIIDSLIATKAAGPATPESMPYFLVMGTFGPAVDFLTVKKIREEVMSCTHDKAIVDSYMTSFGYTTNDPVWILVPPATATKDAGADDAGGTGSGGKTSTGGSGGAGGSGSGGAQATGGARTGGKQGMGGVGGGGAPGAGGAKTGGTQGSGGKSGSGGSSAGGAKGTGGEESSSGGSAGVQTSSASATGGAKASGGTTGGGEARSGCGCRVGGARDRSTGLGVTLALGALVVGQLRRLCLRREAVAEPMPTKEEDE